MLEQILARSHDASQRAIAAARAGASIGYVGQGHPTAAGALGCLGAAGRARSADRARGALRRTRAVAKASSGPGPRVGLDVEPAEGRLVQVSDGRESTIRALATVTLDARALDELGPETIDRLAELVEARLVQRRAAGEEVLLTPTVAAEIAGVLRRRCGGRSARARSRSPATSGARPRCAGPVDAWVTGGRRLDPMVRASRVAAARGRGEHPRVLRAALGVERAA